MEKQQHIKNKLVSLPIEKVPATDILNTNQDNQINHECYKIQTQHFINGINIKVQIIQQTVYSYKKVTLNRNFTLQQINVNKNNKWAHF